MKIMADKEMTLAQVLQKLATRRGIKLPPDQYVFKAFNSNNKSGRKLTNEQSNDKSFNEMLQYKSMYNINVFNMNMEVRNLHSFDLELTEKLFADSMVRRSPAKIISRSLAGTFSEEFKQLSAVGTHSPKK